MMLLREFLLPFVTLSCCMALCVASLDQLCLLYQIFQATSARLASERWLREQCADPHFFSKMHLHTDLCFTVENDARVGAVMLSLREFTQRLLGSELLLGGRGWLLQRLLSWPALLGLAALLLLGPSWLMYGCRPSRHAWPECRDVRYKDA
jgi:hypothetical protein